MLPFEQLQMKVGKSISIIRRPGVKIGLVMKEFRKIAVNFGRWVHPPETMCVRGCSHCCRTMPLLRSKLEFDFVYSEVKYIFFHTRSWMEKYSDKWNALAKILGPSSKAAKAAWRGMGIPCPLLSEEGTCLIYENRPIDCRIQWTPQYFLASCFSNTPIFPMMEGPNRISALESSGPLIPPRPTQRPDSMVDQIINNTLRDIDKWVFNYEGTPKPLIETIESSFVASHPSR